MAISSSTIASDGPPSPLEKVDCIGSLGFPNGVKLKVTDKSHQKTFSGG
jgi:hypothetical protein